MTPSHLASKEAQYSLSCDPMLISILLCLLGMTSCSKARILRVTSAYEAESLSGITDRVQWVDRGQVFKRIGGDG
jgi:hypothetical protein